MTRSGPGAAVTGLSGSAVRGRAVKHQAMAIVKRARRRGRRIELWPSSTRAAPLLFGTFKTKKSSLVAAWSLVKCPSLQRQAGNDDVPLMLVIKNPTHANVMVRRVDDLSRTDKFAQASQAKLYLKPDRSRTR
jgi:hypothetical protein